MPFSQIIPPSPYYHVRNEVPVYVRYRIQNAWGWCTGMIQRDDMGWEVGGGFRIGNSCTPVADSCQCTAKPIQYCKAKIRRRQWHPTPVLLPGKSHEERSLVGYSPWGHKELDTTEQLSTTHWNIVRYTVNTFSKYFF